MEHCSKCWDAASQRRTVLWGTSPALRTWIWSLINELLLWFTYTGLKNESQRSRAPVNSFANKVAQMESLIEALKLRRTNFDQTSWGHRYNRCSGGQNLQPHFHAQKDLQMNSGRIKRSTWQPPLENLPYMCESEYRAVFLLVYLCYFQHLSQHSSVEMLRCFDFSRTS